MYLNWISICKSILVFKDEWMSYGMWHQCSLEGIYMSCGNILPSSSWCNRWTLQSSNPKMEAGCYSEILAYLYQTTWCQTTEARMSQSLPWEDLKFDTTSSLLQLTDSHLVIKLKFIQYAKVTSNIMAQHLILLQLQNVLEFSDCRKLYLCATVMTLRWK